MRPGGDAAARTPWGGVRHIGLEETDDGVWSIYFNTVLLATLDERGVLIRG